MRQLTALGLALCLLVLSGCAPEAPPAPSPAGEGAVTFTDALGREVTVAGRPQRVAALIGSFASVWTLAGGEVAATADDAWTEFDLDLPEGTVNLGKSTRASLEKLLAADPDFVIASVNTPLNLEWRETLEAAGIAAAYFDVNTFAEYLEMLDICTQITGRPELYEANGAAVEAQVEAAVARADGSAPRVLCLRATAVSVKVKRSEGNVLGEMLADLGCVNIADGDGSLLEQLSLERIMEADPDCIFIVRQGQDSPAIAENLGRLLTDHPAWASMTAVREGRVYDMDPQLYNLKPNHRWGEAYEKLADLLYPS